jgi:hypothetical protein
MMITLCPRITADDHCLKAKTSLVSVLLTFGLRYRSVVVNRTSRNVVIHTKTAWFWNRTETHPFDQIAAVTYEYDEFSLLNRHDPIDRFIIGLRPKVGQEFRLFDFIGDGGFTNGGPLPDWWYWEDIVFDYTGSQEPESRAFAQLLSKLLGVKIEPSSFGE